MDMTWEGTCTLSKHMLNVVHNFKFNTMTPVQVATIPVFMKNKDVCVEAVTGSGKTLAFVIPLLEILMRRQESLKKRQIGGLIISPTRELACQIFDVLNSFLDDNYCPFKSSLLIGGRGGIEEDIKDFASKGSNIVVGTPGRINFALTKCDLLQSGMRTLEVLILDEADRLLDLGFHKTLKSILSYLPKQRRTGLFSATQTHEVEQLIKAGMRNPVKITVSEKTDTFAAEYTSSKVKTPASLSNQYLICQPQEKFNHLINILSSKKNDKVLIFFSTCACVDYFGRAVKELLGTELTVLLLHGRMRKKRLDIFNDFRKMTSGVLACTDVMARGIDIPDVDWVLQYDPPSNASAFVHRCGRTARVGRKGTALVFLLESEAAYVDFIEINQKAPMVEHTVPAEKEREGPDWLTKLRNLATHDRAMLERGTRAFVSFVQSYAKHECSLIFRLKDLNFGELATGFALLKMPKMPELRNKEITDFVESEIDTKSIPYKDKVREKQRKAQLRRPVSEQNANKPKFVPKRLKAWSETRKRKEKKKLKRETKRMKKEAKVTMNEDELDELRQDALLLKKLKKGKIAKKDYDLAVDEMEEKMFKDGVES